MTVYEPNEHRTNSCSNNVNGDFRPSSRTDQRLHRIRTVRRQQGISLRTAARHLGSNVRETRDQEDESTDIRLSDLYRWQEALEVPLEELLVESDKPLSRPVKERARMVRVMKTASSILELAPPGQLRRFAQMLVDQLIDLMPELKEVGPWHSVGQRRSLDEFGRIVERRIPDDLFQYPTLDSGE